MSFVLRYDKSRFPIRPKREDGTYGCRGCGADIPPNRKAWCSQKCLKTFHPGEVRRAVKERDKGICAACGRDCIGERKAWRQARNNPQWTFAEWRLAEPPRAEYDHIVPFSEGGLTVIENIRTLCAPCHVKRTAEWRRSKIIPARPQER